MLRDMVPHGVKGQACRRIVVRSAALAAVFLACIASANGADATIQRLVRVR